MDFLSKKIKIVLLSPNNNYIQSKNIPAKYEGKMYTYDNSNYHIKPSAIISIKKKKFLFLEKGKIQPKELSESSKKPNNDGESLEALLRPSTVRAVFGANPLDRLYLILGILGLSTPIIILVALYYLIMIGKVVIKW